MQLTLIIKYKKISVAVTMRPTYPAHLKTCDLDHHSRKSSLWRPCSDFMDM